MRSRKAYQYRKVGDHFGKLTVIGDTGKRTHRGEKILICRCDCGNIVKLRSDSLGRTLSCGCNRKVHFKDGTYLPHIQPDKRLQSNNTSGVTGVSWDKNSGKWRAALVLQQHKIYLGLYRSFDQAVAARKNAEREYWGPFWEK